MRALKARLSDTNTNLRPKAAEALGLLAAGVGPSIAMYTKFVMRDLLAAASDRRKVLLRALASQCMYAHVLMPVCPRR